MGTNYIESQENPYQESPGKRVKIPYNWEKEPNCDSRSELLNNRKRENQQSNITYEWYHEKTSKGQDNLYKQSGFNEEQRNNKNLVDSINNIIKWRTDGSDTNRSHRIIIKKSEKLLTTDDISPLRYSESQANTSLSDIKTKSQLTEMRRNEIKEAGIKIGKKWEEKTKQYLFFKRDNPPKQELEKSASYLEYNKTPKYRTSSELVEARKETMLGNLISSSNYTHKDASKRLKEREAQSHNRIDVLSWKEKVEQRKNEDMSKLQEVFGSDSNGIRRKELPKFLNNNREYWKNEENERNRENSRKTLWQKRKLGGKPESLIIDESIPVSPMFDSSKPHWKIEETPEKIAEKPTRIRHDSYSPESLKNHHKSSWSKYLLQFSGQNSKSEYQITSAINSQSPVKKIRKQWHTPKKQESYSMLNRLINKGNHLSASPAKRAMLSTGFGTVN
ncbi:unnamed protein product [Blepharisma stoltei]|uniref:Uncharacterized protein n=1 Tax=Blepharisma stoltei TaxID=1481888 RepID=A0AAU9J364_9CILI|nr:unnamed protein product [Blepharisma stoltei]